MSTIPIFDSIEEIPRGVGILYLADVNVYEAAADGVRFSYRYPLEPQIDRQNDAIEKARELVAGPTLAFSNVKADGYLYESTHGKLSDDLLSETLMAAFQESLSEIHQAASMGHYSHLEQLTAEYLPVPVGSEEPAWLWAAVRYRQVGRPGVTYEGDRISHLAMRADGGYINKVRYTYPADLPAGLAYIQFLLFLFEWRHSVKRRLAGRLSLPVGGDPNDLEWVKALDTIRHSPLPHPLGFFDEQVAERRQKEALYDHFGQKADAPYVKLRAEEIAETLHHETAHAVFALLERDMMLEPNVDELMQFVNQSRGGEPTNAEQE